jgi:tetratricopeptide (TPR) repeat protein
MTITTYNEWLDRVDTDSENVSKDKEELYEFVKEGYDKFDGSSRADLTWRMGRAAYKVAAAAELLKDTKKVKKYIEEAEEWTRKAIDLNSSCAEGHFWYATVSGKACDFLPTKERISRAKEIQQHLEEAIKIQPEEFVAYYTYGRWCFEVAGLSWMERKIASVVFGSPPEATYQDAMEKFLKVDTLKPAWKANLIWIAKSAVKVKDYKTAIKYADMASAAEATDEEDVLFDPDLQEILTKYASYRS